jgi:hypothetical protein
VEEQKADAREQVEEEMLADQEISIACIGNRYCY